MEKEILVNLPTQSRVWIYTSSRAFTDKEVAHINQFGENFAASWKTHGAAMDAGITVYGNRFIIVAVNEDVTQVSGCGIDSSVGFIKEMEKQFEVVLLDKLNLAFRNANNEIQVLPMFEFQKQIDAGVITDSTLVFNNMISTLSEVRSKWEVPLAQSWHAQLI